MLFINIIICFEVITVCLCATISLFIGIKNVYEWFCEKGMLSEELLKEHNEDNVVFIEDIMKQNNSKNWNILYKITS